jgi:hypothetical protein
MSRSSFRLLAVVGTVIVMSGCASDHPSVDPSAAVGTEVVNDSLKSGVAAPAVSLPQSPGTSQLPLTAAPVAAAQKDATAMKSALSDRKVMANLRAVGLQVAASLGVPSPATLHVHATMDHQQAETIVSGATVNDHAPVFTMVITGGRFTATDHPPGVPAPEGDVLVVTVDAATNRITDIGILNEAPDLSGVALATINLGVK